MSLPPPVDLTHHLSRSTLAREPSNVKRFYKYFAIPGIGQLAGGLPNPSYFPYDNLEAKISLPDRWDTSPNIPVEPPSGKLAKVKLSDDVQRSSKLVVPHDSPESNLLRKIDVATALQYGTAQGYPPLYSFIREFVRTNLHPNVPYKDGPEVILTCGNTDGLSKALQALSNEWSVGRDPVEEREGILVERYCYMNAVQTARPRGMNIAPVGMDDEGMRAYGEGGLEDVLENWDYSKGKRPHLMYTVTLGQNPTGGALSVKRRKEIYGLCVKYDIIIIEDEPYWNLQYPSALRKDQLHTLAPGKKSSGFPYLDSLIPSYLSVDYEGRVVRLDTFSKTIAPGCRCGWITAQPAIVERILRVTESSTQQPSGFVQAMVAELIMGPQNSKAAETDGLSTGWKVDGWVRWLEGLRGAYERRMTSMCDILDEGKFLVKSGRRNSLDTLIEDLDDWSVIEKTQLYSFDRPVAGMFVWIRFDFNTHPLRKSVPLPKLAQALWVFWTTEPYLALAAPGGMFAPTPEVRDEDAWQFYRLCFAACNEDQVEPITQRFVKGASDFWRIKSKEKIDELLGDIEADSSIETLSGKSGMACLTAFC